MIYKLSELFDLQMGKTPSRNNASYWNSKENKWISIGDLSKCDIYISDTKEYISNLAVLESGIKLIPKNTVIMSFKLSIGKAAITAEDMYSNEAIMAFLDKNIAPILPEYLCYMFNYMNWEVGTNKAVLGKTLNKATLSEIKIKIHGLNEQKIIIKKLNKLKQTISARNKQLKLYDKLVKSLFVEMFGDTVINPLGWEEHKLEEYIDFLTSGSRGWAKYFVNEENELFLTIKNVKNNKIVLDDIQYIKAPKNKEAERTKVKCGDLLISITADLGRTGVIDKDISSRGAYINQHLSLVRLDQNRINPQYISYYLEADAGKRQFCSKNQNGVKAGLNFDAIKSLNIIVPPIELQDDFVKNIYFIDKHKSVVQKSLDETQILFDSLMQKYFG